MNLLVAQISNPSHLFPW